MNELQVRQALLSQGEILSLKYSGIGSITISLVSTKHWVAEIGLSKLQIGTKVLNLKIEPKLKNENDFSDQRLRMRNRLIARHLILRVL